MGALLSDACQKGIALAGIYDEAVSLCDARKKQKEEGEEITMGTYYSAIRLVNNIATVLG